MRKKKRFYIPKGRRKRREIPGWNKAFGVRDSAVWFRAKVGRPQQALSKERIDLFFHWILNKFHEGGSGPTQPRRQFIGLDGRDRASMGAFAKKEIRAYTQKIGLARKGGRRG
jgi:hypothetical protein